MWGTPSVEKNHALAECEKHSRAKKKIHPGTIGDAKTKWKGILKEFQKSSLNPTGFAREHQISKASLYQWSKKLSIPLKKEPVLSFIELKPLPETSKSEFFLLR